MSTGTNVPTRQSPKQPPYISYTTFNNALASLAEQEIPTPIDRSVLKQFSGANQGLVLNTLRFMGLTNEKDEPTEKLYEYAKADTEKRKSILAQLLTERYSEQVQILPNGTPQKFKESFDNLNVEASVKKKCISFFLQMAKATSFPISTHIQKGERGTRKGGQKTIKKKDSTISKDLQHNEVPKGMVQVPIAVGVGKENEWAVIVREPYSKDDVDKFLQIIKITLGDGKKK